MAIHTMVKRKGIVLAGGTGSRLAPATNAISKQLMPVYDKPMIYYPLSTLMLADITDILIITKPEEQVLFERLLGDGRQWGLNLSYATQSAPRGIAEALVIGAAFLDGDPVALILGDNIFYGQGLGPTLRQASQQAAPAALFASPVKDPSRYGVVEIGPDAEVVSLEEKPSAPRSNLAVTGLYMFDGQAPALAASLEPSARGELEITDLNRVYLKAGGVSVHVFERGYAWLDMGTFESLLDASSFVSTIERRQGFKISCPEEIAWRRGFIDGDQFATLAANAGDNDYGNYLTQLSGDARR